MLKHYSAGSMKKAVIIAIAVVVLGALFFLSQRFKMTPKPLSPEEIMARQMEELDKLRKETPPLTQEQLDKQREELDKLRKQSQAQPLSPEEINKQIEELDKLRSQSN